MSGYELISPYSAFERFVYLAILVLILILLVLIYRAVKNLNENFRQNK